jgi:hypothetical protein
VGVGRSSFDGEAVIDRLRMANGFLLLSLSFICWIRVVADSLTHSAADSVESTSIEGSLLAYWNDSSLI